MSVASINKNNNRRTTSADTPAKFIAIDSIAKKILFKTFSKFTSGRMIVEDAGEVHSFGEDSSTAEVTGHMFIHHSAAYREIAFGGSIGGGESYMYGHWSSSNLVDVIRVIAANVHAFNAMDKSRPITGRLFSKMLHLLNANTFKGSKKNIAAHYDLGNDFFELFLDPSMMYSSAMFSTDAQTLEQASFNKLDTICKKLNLTPEDHLVEIGTGWGGMAIHAAKHYGCQVTTTTISQQQYNYAKQAVEAAGLSDKVTLLLKDYRELDGKFTKLVSIEMIEAVGHRYYKKYFEKCSNLLAEGGQMLIQAITIADQRYQQAKHSVDFIQRYIFPGGCLPSNQVIADCTAKFTDMMIIDMEDIGIDYSKTLAEWRKRFNQQIDRVKQMGFNDIFVRMWEFYLCYCEGGFAERAISTNQIVFAKPGAKAFSRV